jgi:uncharacterized protein (TIGR03437 family)
VKQVLRLPFFVLALLCLSLASASAQTATPTPTPDPFITQISSSATNTFVRDVSGDGRFVVFESEGDIATVPPGQTAATKSPNNADGNREIFLYDFAQRRIFQITDTKNALKSTTIAAADLHKNDNVQVEVSNNHPAISHDGKWIVFSSNATTPFSFDGDVQANEDALKADGNQEIFLYHVPDVAPASLTSGDLPAYTDLRQNAFTRVTNTPASRLPSPGFSNVAPFIAPFTADDNREASINDDGTRIVFISTRNLATVNGKTNADASPEVYAYNTTGSGAISQITDTVLDATHLFVFCSNPSISGQTTGTSVIAFVSNATDLRAADPAVNIASGNADGDAEVFVANYNGATVTSMKQATRTKRKITADVVNFFSPGRRINRDGTLVVFDSVAADPKADDSTTNDPNRAIFVYNISADTFVQVGARAATADGSDVLLRFPVFTGDGTRIVFASDLNLKTDGTRVDQDDATGLNPSRINQVFSTTIPATSTSTITVTRLSNLGGTRFTAVQPFASDTPERTSFSLANVANIGTGNTDLTNEAYYLIAPPAPSTADTPAASSALQLLTGASRREVATPAASPTPTPSPTPSVPPVTGIAIGEIGIVRTTSTSPATLAPSEKRACPAVNPGCDAASESMHRPSLPVELNGVSLSVNGSAAGLYFVSPDEIQFVVPPGLTAQTGSSTYPVVINIRNGATVRTVRTVLQVVAAQPDIFTSTNGAGGRAAVTNVTNPLLAVGTPEPFNVTTTYVDSTGQSVTAATKLRLVLTGLNGVVKSTITVRLTKSDNTTVDLTGDAIPLDPQPTDTPGVSTLDFVLPASLAGAGDVAVTVIFNTTGAASRPADTAPRFHIN